MRLLRVGVLALSLGFVALPSLLLALLLAGALHAPKLRPSGEPFILNPRFCLGIGNECAVQPTLC